MTTIILFGITGDLAKKKLIPALAEIYKGGQDFKYVGFGRKDFSAKDFHNFIAEHAAALDAGLKKGFAERWSYVRSELDDRKGYRELAGRAGKGGDILLYVSLPPQFHMDVISGLASVGLLGKNPKPASKGAATKGVPKIVLEKPFGVDEKSAKDLWKKISSLVGTDSLYLVDHYGAKQSVMELETFAKTGFFQDLYKTDLVKKIKVTLKEKKDAGGRGVLYDSIGTLKDVGQNHVLRMLTSILLAMKFNPKKSEKNKLKRSDIISKLRPRSVSIGQYRGFRNEPGVNPESQTETYFYAKNTFEDVEVDLEAGKATSADDSSVVISMNDKNSVTIPVNGYGSKDAYVTVFERAMLGDRSVFAEYEEILASWRYAEKAKKLAAKAKLRVYSKGAI